MLRLACLHVCLFVCLSVCPLAYLLNHTSKFHPIFCTCSIIHAAVARSFSGCNAILWMASCFHVIEQMGRINDDAYVLSSSPGGGTEGEVCYLRVHLINVCDQNISSLNSMSYSYRGYERLN